MLYDWNDCSFGYLSCLMYSSAVGWLVLLWLCSFHFIEATQAFSSATVLIGNWSGLCGNPSVLCVIASGYSHYSMAFPVFGTVLNLCKHGHRIFFPFSLFIFSFISYFLFGDYWAHMMLCTLYHSMHACYWLLSLVSSICRSLYHLFIGIPGNESGERLVEWSQSFDFVAHNA